MVEVRELVDKFEKRLEIERNNSKKQVSGKKSKTRAMQPMEVDGELVENDGTLDDNDDVEGGSRRPITYQIAKNKGLTPHRRKDERNPRVKHRKKFKKAIVRRKGAVSFFLNNFCKIFLSLLCFASFTNLNICTIEFLKLKIGLFANPRGKFYP